MSDIIQLLPDAVANQIAAGEVVQRPASVVKELLENAIDSGATNIKLIIKDAGRTLVQVTDDGCGMSEKDCIMCFERHATSKIKTSTDIFAIRTKGFRGEAMASIAAVAQVELKSRLFEEELGTVIQIEGSDLKSNEPCSCTVGTSIAVKNLFFNVPARRNFLKSNSVETKHIIDEFQRVALAHPEVTMLFYNNDNEIFNLISGNLKQRIIGLFGKKYDERLAPLEQSTDIVKIRGFIGKPEFAKKTRGEQYFFINNRFIKSSYLNHSVVGAYTEIISKGQYPTYFIFLDVDPSFIDINIHPTKTEIKFEDEKYIYAILHSTVRQSLGKFNISPTLDFEQESSFSNTPLKPLKPFLPPTIQVNPDFNPFTSEGKKSSGFRSNGNSGGGKSPFKFSDLEKFQEDMDQGNTKIEFESVTPIQQPTNSCFQIHNKYIISPIRSGYIMVDQQKAHERIHYEKLLIALENNSGTTQQQLFPISVEFNSSDMELVKELMNDFKSMGFDLAEFGKNTIVINGTPADAIDGSPQELLEDLLEQFKYNVENYKLDKRENLAQSLARGLAIKAGKSLSSEEMISLIDELFACEIPYFAPNGKPAIITFTLEEIAKKFDA